MTLILMKYAGVTAWLAATAWILLSYLPRRTETLQDSACRARAEWVLAQDSKAAVSAARRSVLLGVGRRLAEPDLAEYGRTGTRVVIDIHGAPSLVADTVDHAVRRIGMHNVLIAREDRRVLYWVLVELARRGYDENELLSLLYH